MERRKLLALGEHVRLQQQQAGADSGAALLSQPLDGRVFREPAHKSGVLVACGEALASAGNGDSRSAWPLGGAAGAAAGAKRKRCSDDGGTGAGE